MAETQALLDRSQVKKAVQALQAFLKTKGTGESLFLDETQKISILFTLWKIPKEPQTIRIPLPHGQRSDTDEICLFTRDEPSMTSEQTQRFYKKLLQERGVRNIEIIPYKVLKTEYKPYQAKRRLLENFDLFISDDRVRRLLPTHLGKHFYLSKKEPLPVNLTSKHLARDIERIIQGTSLKVTNKGCCCMAHVAHSGMTADEVVENIEAVVQTVVAKLRMKGPVIKLIHIKSQSSVALPIYNSDLGSLRVLDVLEAAAKKQKKKTKKKDKKQADTAAEGKGKEKKVKKNKAADEEEEEEIPQLVPIETPIKKPKLEKPSKKKKLEKAATPAAVKKGTKAQSKRTKTDSKVKRKVPKVK